MGVSWNCDRCGKDVFGTDYIKDDEAGHRRHVNCLNAPVVTGVPIKESTDD